MAAKHILIAVPTMAGLMKSKTATTLITLMRDLTQAGIKADYLNVDSSDIVYARNYYARTMLQSKTLDAMLFVDSDMQFRSALVMRMLNLDVDFAAAAYPKRQIDMDAYSRALAQAEAYTPEAKSQAMSNTYHFTLLRAWDTSRAESMEVSRGFTRMAAVGMGCALITRAALQAMIDGGAVEPRKEIIDGVTEVGWNFFDCLKMGDLTLSEDYSFCYRWTKTLGRDLWVCVDEPVTHLGEFEHTARYLDRLRKVGPAPASGSDD